MNVKPSKKYGIEYKFLGWFIIFFCIAIALFTFNSKGIDEIFYTPEYIDSIRIDKLIIITSKEDIGKFSEALHKSEKFRQCHCKGGFKAIALELYSAKSKVYRMRIEYHLDMPPRIRANDFEYSNDTFIHLVEDLLNKRSSPLVPTGI